MSYGHLPRKPVRFIEENQDLLKSQEGLAGQRQGATDFSEDVPHMQIEGQVQSYYRAPLPTERVNGNEIFRRYINGTLDYNYACNKIIDALHRVKDGGGVDQLNTEEKVALSLLFPEEFDYVDSGMVEAVASIHCRITMAEVMHVREKVAHHLAEEMNWNAGYGGGSVPGRSQTRS